jgi:PST family polysaccharide transporter
MEEKAILGVPWTVVSYAVNKGVSTLATLVLAHLLMPSDFGLIALALIVVNFLYWFGGLSVGSALIVRQELDARGVGTAFTLTVASGVVAAAVAAALSPLIGDAFANGRVTGLLLALTSVFVITGFTSFYDALLQRELEFRRRFAALATQTIAYAVITITLAALGAGVWSLVIGQIGSAVLYAVALLIVAPYRVRPAFDRVQARSLIVSGRGFLAQGWTVFVRQNADMVTVGRAFGAAALGFYSMAYRLGDLSYWAIADPVARVTFPAFARSRLRGEDIRASFLSVLRMVALVGCPVGVMLSGAAEPFTRAILGPRWLPMVAPLTVLGIWSAIRPIDTTLFWLLNAVDRADLVAWMSLAILVPLVPGFIIAVSIGHLEAVALVVVIDTLISVIWLALLVRRHVQIRLREIWSAVAPIVLASPPAWAATFTIGHVLSRYGAGLSLIGAVAGGIAAYALALSLLDRSLLGHAAGQLLRVMGRGPAPTSVTSEA